MSALPIREVVIAKLSELSDEQVAEVLEFIQAVEVEDDLGTADAGVEDDPLVGFISGPTDAAENTKAILKAEFGLPKSRDNERE